MKITRYTNLSSECSISCNIYTIQMQRIPSTPTKITSTPTKTATTPTKTASTPNIDLCGFVARHFFVANLRTFMAYNLQAKKYGDVQKMTNIRYGEQSVVHNSFDVLPSGADQGSCAHKGVCYNVLNRREKCRK